MKNSLIIGLLLILTISCSKNNTDNNNECGCSAANPTCATIVKVVANCNSFGIEVKGVQYPAANIPDAFKATGLKVCVKYSLYDELSSAPCAPGTWANIASMELAD